MAVAATLITALVQAPVAFAARRQPLGSRVLRRGMSGSDVRALQTDLSRAGFHTPAVGVFGPITQRNVSAFERRFHLRANGVANHAFFRELSLVLATGAG
ncbi:MAG: peptidoglycan-binding domain-containing protein, partial [Solirubrobacteraceae bacterium]